MTHSIASSAEQFKVSHRFRPLTSQTDVQQDNETQFRKERWTGYDVECNHPYTMTNMPISRILKLAANNGNDD